MVNQRILVVQTDFEQHLLSITCDLIKFSSTAIYCLTLHVVTDTLNFLHMSSLQFETKDCNSNNDQNKKNASE